MTGQSWSRRLGWSLGSGIGTQLPTLVSFVWVARYVPPEGFGTMAIAWLVAGVGQILLLETVSDALVRRAETGPADRDTTFWLCLGAGIVLAALTAAVARPAAHFFDDAMLAAVLPVLAIRLLFDALVIVPESELRRAYAVRVIAMRGAIANSIAAAAAIGLAIAGYGVWALVTQQVVLGMIGAAVAWSAAPFRPGLPRARPARDIWSYAASASLFRSVDFASANLDRFMVGRFRSAADLGHYAIALRVQQLLLELIVGNALRLVALPLFAQVGRNRLSLREAFLKALSLTACVAFPCLAGAASLAGSLIPFAFGEAWQPAVPVIQLLMAEGMVTSLAMLNSALLRALGRPNQWLLVQTAAFILGTLFVWAAVHQSILLVAVAVLAKALLVFPLHLGLVRRACGITLVQYARALRSPLLCTFAMVATVGLGQGWLPADFGPLPRLTFGVTTGVVSYILPMMLLFRRDIAPLFARNG